MNLAQYQKLHRRKAQTSWTHYYLLFTSLHFKAVVNWEIRVSPGWHWTNTDKKAVCLFPFSFFFFPLSAPSCEIHGVITESPFSNLSEVGIFWSYRRPVVLGNLKLWISPNELMWKCQCMHHSQDGQNSVRFVRGCVFTWASDLLESNFLQRHVVIGQGVMF